MKPWSIKNEIQKQVNREAEFEWAKKPTNPLPKYIPPKIEKGRAGWINFFIILKELKP